MVVDSFRARLPRKPWHSVVLDALTFSGWRETTAAGLRAFSLSSLFLYNNCLTNQPTAPLCRLPPNSPSRPPLALYIYIYSKPASAEHNQHVWPAVSPPPGSVLVARGAARLAHRCPRPIIAHCDSLLHCRLAGDLFWPHGPGFKVCAPVLRGMRS